MRNIVSIWTATLTLFTVTPVLAKDADIYIDKGACPFECCTYRAWRVTKAFPLYNKIQGSSVLESINAGAKIQALTGEVHSVPYRTQATADSSEHGIKKGDEIDFLTPLGEGIWRVRRRGKVFELPDAEDITDFVERTKKSPRQSTWWIKLKSPTGKLGWAREQSQFSGEDMDQCS